MNVSTALSSLIAEQGGKISFERFMQFALHDSQHGYYARRISAVGTKGDFTTTAEISPALAKAIAAWAVDAIRKTGVRHIIEIGPGNGTLAAAVWKNLPMLPRWRTTFHLVDASAPLRALQQENPALKRAKFHADISSALAAAKGQSLIYSNELFDAFPARVMRHNGNAWEELFLRMFDGVISEEWHEDSAFSWNSSYPFPEKNQRIEVPSAAMNWLKSWLPSWKKGAMLHIDYGHQAADLGRLSQLGTTRGYLLHQRVTGTALYQNIGRTDITYDVNFSDLIDAVAPFTSEHSIITQQEFLTPYADGQNHGDQQAIDPHGAGTAFLVWTCTAKEGS